MNIDLFKREHMHIAAEVTELRGLMQSGVRENAEAIVWQLTSTSEMIEMHLTAEDRILYPAFARAMDPSIAQVSKRFQKEMGDLAAVYTAFIARWNLAAKVAADPEGFRDDATAVFNALLHRVQRENRELYPLAGRV